MKPPLLALLLLLLLVGAGTAAAQDAGEPVDDLCGDSALDPVPVTLRTGGIDATRSACLRSDFEVRAGGHALVDTPDFYGTLGGDLAIGIRFVEQMLFEWGATIQVADVTFAQTAVVSTTEASYGPITVHAAIGHRFTERLRLSAIVLAELPFTRSITDTSASGGQLAALATVRLHPRLVVHGRAGLLGWYASSIGGTTRRGAVVASADAAIRTVPWLHAFAGVELGAGWYRSGVDHVAARAGAHWRVFGPWRLDAGVLLPLLGDERTDLAFTLGVRRDR